VITGEKIFLLKCIYCNLNKKCTNKKFLLIMIEIVFLIKCNDKL